LLDQFLIVNRDLRSAAEAKVMEVVQKSDPQIYWKDVFLRLPNSSTKAGFADHREYHYKNRVIDNQVHLGIDLASLAKSQIPAANGGKIIFADDISIYGKTVFIDHGFGLMSMYSHLSSFSVKVGQMVEKGGIIGTTGITGLAGGDHLHFAMIVHNTFVNPIEWWDSSWITNNVTDKLKAASSG
jgi:murein DD-endopeptidase MepM/ murein hydrolase activator NlpD